MSRKVVCIPGICDGSPCIEGTRITCANAVFMIYYQMSIQEYLTIHDYLSEEDLRECLRYCSDQECITDEPANFCEGCSLGKKHEERPARFLESEKALKDYVLSGTEIDGYAYLGSKEDYEKHELPEDIWKLSRACMVNLSSCPISPRRK